MISRAIDIDPFAETIEEKIFRNAKRLCIIFAVGAVTLSALDIANIHTIENAAAVMRGNNLNVAGFSAPLRAGIELITFTSDEPTAIAAIPLGNLNIASNPMGNAMPPIERQASVAPRTQTTKNKSKPDASPVAGLAAVGSRDAVEFAMAPSMTPSMPPPAATLRSELRIGEASMASLPSYQVASADPTAMPSSLSTPGLPTPSLADISSSPMSTPIPLAMVPMPRPAPGVPPPSPAQRLKLEGKNYAKAEKCLANAIYFEARSEPVRGQMAVAQVVVNRAFSGFYPNDICGVVYQNASRHLSCQFTFACDGKSKAITERGHWARAVRIAKQTLDGQIYVPEVAKSTHYHAIYVHPNWVGEMRKMVRYGLHNFYRPYAWGNGAEEPVWGSAAMAQASAKKN
ncbi:MAG TPA: cell wall hydrolase [Pseudolabrys sp.]